MNQEVELKLRLSPSQAAYLSGHPLLSGITPVRQRLLNTYFDTPDLALRARGIAVRFRRKGWDWLLTVKGGGGSGAGGLAQRSEWEAPARPGVFDFSIVGDHALREFLEGHAEHLQPVCTTDFTRSAWLLERAPDTTLEIALDRGQIKANGKTSPICEIELELVGGNGSLQALFQVALELAADIRLHPEIFSKAERGYALFKDGPSPCKALPSPVVKSMTPVEAFRAVALSCLAQLQRNEEGALAGDNPEFVHQARVAIRRLRSSFRLFAPVLPAAFIAEYSPRWRDLAARLGGARDWDVFLEETLAPLEQAFPGNPDLAHVREHGEAAQAAAQSSAGNALSRPGYSRLLLAFTAALFFLEERKPIKLRRFARRRLHRRGMQIAALAQGHAKMNAAQRHELRIAFKKLRYALEFFAPLLPEKRLRAYQPALAELQDRLGRLNDLATAARLIAETHAKKKHSLTHGWIAGRQALLLEDLGTELQHLLELRTPW